MASLRTAVGAAAVVFVLFASSVHADTTISAGITTNTTWTAAASPYLVTTNVSVSSGVTLTIEPGVTVRFNDGYALNINGKLYAAGTTADPIILTTSRVSPSAGSWSGVEFAWDSDSTSELSHAVVSYAGVSGAAIRINHSNPTISNVTVSDSSTAGIRVYNGAQASITGCILVRSGSYGINLESASSVTLANTNISDSANYAISTATGIAINGLSGMTLSGNGSGTKNAIEHRGGTISGTETWRASAGAVPWLLTADLTISASGTLTIQPGVTVLFNDLRALNVSGTLTAIGTSSAPIVFTTSRVTPVKGAWSKIHFYSGAPASASRISYATIEYAGAFANGMLVIDGSSPVLDHVTIADSSTSGLYVSGSSARPAISESTIARSSAYGIDLRSGGGIDVSSTTISDSTNYAIGAEPGTAISGLSGMTVSGNGAGSKNAIGYRGGGIAGEEIWRASAGTIPWEVTADFSIAATGTLTIEPGTVVNFTDLRSINISGTLNAVGTETQRILFTTSRATPIRGAWSQVHFHPGVRPSASRISFADFEYGGAYASGQVVADGSSPVFDHVTFSNSSSAGLYAQANGSLAVAPVLTNCHFNGNTTGAGTSSGAAIDARLCWWDSDTGPSGSGPGTGQGVSSAVRFAPWLTAAPSSPHFISAASIGDARFNPSIGAVARFAFATVGAGTWTVSIQNAAGTTIRTFTGTGDAATVDWDAKDDSGVLLADGMYKLIVASVTSGGAQATTARARLDVDRTKAFVISNRSVSPAYISPNADNVQDRSDIRGTSNYDNVSWTITIKNPSGATVRTISTSGAALNTAWDGKDAGAVLVVDGAYTVETLGVLGPSSSQVFSDLVAVDTTPPLASITTPTETVTLSNVYQNGTTDVDVNGTASDAALQTWTLESSGPNQGWAAIATGTASVSASRLAVWTTGPLSNGAWTLRLTATDRGGNKMIVQRLLTLGNFKVTQSATQLDASGSGSVNYTSTIPFTMNQILEVRDDAGSVVRTLFSGSRPAGVYVDTWDGKGNGAESLRDGAYVFGSVASVGATSMELNGSLTGPGNPTGLKPTLLTTFDPFNNQPIKYGFQLSQPGLITLLLKDTVMFNGSCDQIGVYCPIQNIWLPAGTHSLEWAGIDGALALRPDLKYALVLNRPVGAVVLFGTKPVVSGLTVSPPIYAPWRGGAQTITLTGLSSHQSQALTVTMAFANQESGSVLRAITSTGVTPGSFTTTWDGRSGDGAWVAPGIYVVTATISDALGNQVQKTTLTKIEY